MWKRASVRVWVLLGAGCASLASPQGPLASASEEAITRIAFGSCFNAANPHGIWETIEGWRPELLLLLGDNVYADTAVEEELRASYAELGAVPAFGRLREGCELLATWDDHDYGVNDGGADFEQREMSQRVFLDFFGVPAESARRAREGVYHARTFGPEGRRVQVILLDTRYFRGPLDPSTRRHVPGDGRPSRYDPSYDATRTLLGEAQWEWLAERLREPAELRLVVSSIQVLSEDHGFESWSRLPLERQRLLALVAESEAEGVVFLSGDRHLGELSILDAGRAAPDSAVEVGYPIVDLTSSSLNVPHGWHNEVNRHRVGSVVHPANFGTVEIEWGEPTRLSLSLRDEEGEVVLVHTLELGDLSF